MKWTLPLKGDADRFVIDSKGTLYVLSSDRFSVMQLTAVLPSGKVSWTKPITGNWGVGLALAQDKYLIVLGSLGTGGNFHTDDNGKDDYDGYAAVLSKYATDGTLLWERQFEDTFIHPTTNNVAVDADGMIAFSGEYTSVLPTVHKISEPIDFKKDLQVFLLSSSGKLLVRTSIESTKNNPLFLSSPVFIKGQLYVTKSKGYWKKISKTTSIGATASGEVLKISKQGTVTKFFAYQGNYHHAEPVYYNNRMYLLSKDHVYVLNLEGKLMTTIRISGVANWNLSISKKGDLVAGQEVFHSNGSKLYRSPNNLIPVNDITIDSGSNLIYPREDFTANELSVVSYNYRSKKYNWQLPIDQSITTPAVIGNDGTVYIAGSKLLAIGQKTS